MQSTPPYVYVYMCYIAPPQSDLLRRFEFIMMNTPYMVTMQIQWVKCGYLCRGTHISS